MFTEIVPEWMRQRVEQGTARHDWIALSPEFSDGLREEGLPCFFCGEQTKKVFQPLTMGPYPGGLIVTVTNMPFYECPGADEPCTGDPTAYASFEGLREALVRTRALLEVVDKDTEAVAHIEQSLQYLAVNQAGTSER